MLRGTRGDWHIRLLVPFYSCKFNEFLPKPLFKLGLNLIISKQFFACHICVFKRSLLGVKICLSHAQIALLQGSQKA